MHPEPLLIRGTALLAFWFYVAAVILLIRWKPTRWKQARLLWTLGCAVFLLHVALAFQFVHAWSHTAAFEHTAGQTAELIGLHWGGGLYLNYAFTLLWVWEAARWWKLGDAFRTRNAVQGFLLFMFLNGAVVFAAGAGRWMGLVGFAVLGSVWWFRRKSADSP